MLCEDNPRVNTLQALTKFGQLIPIAVRRDRPNQEFAGVTFSPDHQTLFFNLQASANAMSVAMWGPWHTLGI